MTMSRHPSFGLGLRPVHYDDVLAGPRGLDWVEVISENYMIAGGRPLHVLERVHGIYPVVLHGVSMNLGSVDGPEERYLQDLKRLIKRFEPMWVSDHLAFTGVNGRNTHDLLPVPLIEEALQLVIRNVHRAQDLLGLELTLENPSSYIQFAGETIFEAEFLAEVSAATGCHLLLDVNNIYVNAFNHGFDPEDYLARLPVGRVRQIHLAGHTRHEDVIIDTHDAPVCEEVWDLYKVALARFGPVPTMIERDANIPPFAELMAELDHARTIAAEVLA